MKPAPILLGHTVEIIKGTNTTPGLPKGAHLAVIATDRDRRLCVQDAWGVCRWLTPPAFNRAMDVPEGCDMYTDMGFTVRIRRVVN